MLTAIIFIIVIGVLVLAHEFGHFIFAKRAGMKVEEFGFGFPPRLYGFKKGETTYSINWIPFGGFVKILGEDGDERGPRTFASASFAKRLMVLVAGVLMNLILAAVFLMVVNFFGLRIGLIDGDTQSHVRDLQIQVIAVSSGSAADKGDIQTLDVIKGYRSNGAIVPVSNTKEVQDVVAAHVGQPVTFEIGRGGATVEKTITPKADHPTDQGALGVSLALTGVISYPWYEAIWRGIYDTGIITINTVLGYYDLLKTLVTHGTLIAEVSGPIGIATLTGQAARVGFSYLLQFVAMISVNLAVLNIIPFPALDGGRVLILIIEKIKRSPVHRRTEGLINAIGFYLLVMLMIYITYKDVSKFFTK